MARDGNFREREETRRDERMREKLISEYKEKPIFWVFPELILEGMANASIKPKSWAETNVLEGHIKP